MCGVEKRAVVHAAEGRPCTPKPTCPSTSVVLHPFTDQTSRQKVKCHPRKRACHKNNRCADVKNSPGPFRHSSHRLDDCEISVGFTFRTALVGVSTNGMSSSVPLLRFVYEKARLFTHISKKSVKICSMCRTSAWPSASLKGTLEDWKAAFVTAIFCGSGHFSRIQKL